MGVNREKAIADVKSNFLDRHEYAVAQRERVLDLEAVLKAVLPFVEKELECRETSYLPEPSKDEEPYLIEAQDALTVIQVALGLKVTNG